MKLSPINKGNTNRGNINYGSKGALLNKPARYAYSALFTLSLLSSVANTSDVFVNSKNNKEDVKTENNIFKPTDKQTNKAQFIYTDMYGNRWVPYRTYKELEKEAEQRKQELEETEAAFDNIVAQDEQLDKYELAVEEQYNEAIKALKDITYRIQSTKQYLDYEIEQYHELESKLLKPIIGGFLGGFALSLGIGTLIKLNKMNRKKLSPDNNKLVGNKD